MEEYFKKIDIALEVLIEEADIVTQYWVIKNSIAEIRKIQNRNTAALLRKKEIAD